jgi:K+-sensing histidine kinase KdpD
MRPVSASGEVAALWLATLQRSLARASHDVKDALNGVSVNLEVIRGRSARPDAPAAAVAPFAEASAQQLDRVTSLIEAVLALGRPERQPADVAITLRRVATVCGASASASDAAVHLDLGDVESATTRVQGDAVRLALAAPLLELVTNGGARGTRAGPVHCALGEEDGAIVVTMRAAGRRATMPESVAEALLASGVRWRRGGMGTTEAGSDDLSLVFPRA